VFNDVCLVFYTFVAFADTLYTSFQYTVIQIDVKSGVPVCSIHKLVFMKTAIQAEICTCKKKIVFVIHNLCIFGYFGNTATTVHFLVVSGYELLDFVWVYPP